jgi:hypothetical protein
MSELDGWETKDDAQKLWDASDMKARDIVSVIDRAIKAEAALRDIDRAAEDGFNGVTTADYAVSLIRNIARPTLEGK